MIQRAAAYFLFFLVSYLFPLEPFSEFPDGVHLWAQSDYLSIINLYNENGHDLVSPSTYVLNPEFPDNGLRYYRTTETAGDLQFQPWLISFFVDDAVSDIVIVRIYYCFFALLLLIFIFEIINLVTACYWSALLVAFFFFCTPLFQYYSTAVLPGLGSLTFAAAGVFVYAKYLKSEKGLLAAILLLLFAAMMRSTNYMWLLAILGIEVFARIRLGRVRKNDLWILLLVFVGIVFHFIVLKSVDENRGSIFLSSLMPFGSFREWMDGLEYLKDNVTKLYFHRAQWVALLVVLVIFLCQFWNARSDSWNLLTVIFFLFAISFFIAMGKQFIHHDYYFLEVFFLPIVLLFSQKIIFLKRIFPKGYYFFHVLVLLVLFPSWFHARSLAGERSKSNPESRITKTLNDYQGLGTYLDSLGYDRETVLFVPDATVPNLPLLLSERRGYSNMTTTKERLSEMIIWPWDLVLVQRDFVLSDIHSVNPVFFEKLEIVGSHRGLLLLRRSELTHSIFDIISPNYHWSAFDSTQLLEEEFVMDKEDKFVLTGDFWKQDEELNNVDFFAIEGAFKMGSGSDVYLVVSGHTGDDQIFYWSKSMLELGASEQGQWRRFVATIPIEEAKAAERFKYYIYNPNGGKGNLTSLKVYRGKRNFN